MASEQSHSHLEAVEAALKAAEPNLIKWRRIIHENPELGYCETATSALIASVLGDLGLEVTTGLAKTGVVGILRGANERPLVGLRADMDALPVKEETGLSFASNKTVELQGKTVNVAHACGHDAHVAILLATAEALVKVKEHLVGSVMFVFQPSEEGNADAPKDLGFNGSGAVQMVYAEKLFDKFPMPDVFFGLHVAGLLSPQGAIAVRAGSSMASSDTFVITIKGLQTHGSQPWTGKDAIVCAAQIINNAQTIVSRNVDLQADGAAVVTFGTIHGGQRHNILSGDCVITGTFRCLSMKSRALIRGRLTEIVKMTAEMNGCTATFSTPTGIPPVVNDPTVAAASASVLRSVLGPENVILNMPAVVGSDDMSVFTATSPGVYMFLFCPPEPNVPLVNHMANFDVHEPSLLQGARAFAHLTMNFMEQPYAAPTHTSTYKEESSSYLLGGI